MLDEKDEKTCNKEDDKDNKEMENGICGVSDQKKLKGT